MKEDYREIERAKKIKEEEAIQEITQKAEQKRAEIISYQEVLYKHARE